MVVRTRVFRGGFGLRGADLTQSLCRSSTRNNISVYPQPFRGTEAAHSRSLNSREQLGSKSFEICFNPMSLRASDLSPDRVADHLSVLATKVDEIA